MLFRVSGVILSEGFEQVPTGFSALIFQQPINDKLGVDGDGRAFVRTWQPFPGGDTGLFMGVFFSEIKSLT